MKLTGGQIVTRALEDEGIRFTFGIPGTHNIELYDALGASDSVQPILVTDEQSASFMADGAWRASGRMACVNVVPGAGLTHAMSGIAEAFMDCVPMLVLGCGIRQDTGKAYQLHDVDQATMVRPVVKATYKPTTGAEIHSTIREACREARSGRPGPVFVEIPADLYLFRYDVELPERTGEEASGPPPRGPSTGRDADLSEPVQIGPASGGAPSPDPATVARAADLLTAARCPLLYVGAGAAAATDHVLALAARLEAPVATTIQGKGVFPEDHPLFLWPGFGDAAPKFVRQVVDGCDATLAVGCRFGEVGTGSYGLEPPGPLIHVDIDPEAVGRNFDAEVGVVADARAFLDALHDALDEREAGAPSGRASAADATTASGPIPSRTAPAVPPTPDDALRATIRQGHADVQEEWLADVGGEGVTPYHLLTTLQRILGPDTIFTTDSGNGTFLAMECLRLQEPGKFLAPVDYSCMGYSVPAALGAQLARPDCPVVALAGDGAFLMTGLELLTGRHQGLGVFVFVLRDRELAQIAQFQETALSRKVASELPDYGLAGIARAVDATYLTVERDDGVEETVNEAVRKAGEGRPVVVDVAIDYSRKTYFTRGVVKTNLLRLPLKERFRFVARALGRRLGI